MEIFTATKVSDAEIELVSVEQLEQLMKVIQDEQNFILMWDEGNVTRSKIYIGNNLNSKVINGDITLTSKEAKQKY